MSETPRWLNGLPYYCAVCGLGLPEFQACEEPDCQLETKAEAEERARRHKQRGTGRKQKEPPPMTNLSLAEKVERLTEAQMRALRAVETWAQGGTYMPFADQASSFEACARKGYLEYRSVDEGSPRNGYALTEAGRRALASKDPTMTDIEGLRARMREAAESGFDYLEVPAPDCLALDAEITRLREDVIQSAAMCDSYTAENQRLFDRAESAEAALAKRDEEVARLWDKVEGLSADLTEAVRIAYKYGAATWVQMNYPKQHATLTKEPTNAE